MYQFADILNVLGFAVGVIGLGYSFYEAKKNRGFRLVYQYDGYGVIRNSQSNVPDGFEVSFHGVPIDNLILSKVFIWNKGRAPLRATDIAMSDPLKISFDETPDILHAKVSRSTRDANGVQISVDSGKKFGNVTFDFLDPKDGFVVDLWHIGSSIRPVISGTIIGQNSGIISYGKFFPQIRQDINPNDRLEVALTKLVGGFFASSRSFSTLSMIFGFFFLTVSTVSYFLRDMVISMLGLRELVDKGALLAAPALVLIVMGVLVRFSMTNFAPKSLYEIENQE